jgi:hypothetical protein
VKLAHHWFSPVFSQKLIKRLAAFDRCGDGTTAQNDTDYQKSQGNARRPGRPFAVALVTGVNLR